MIDPVSRQPGWIEAESMVQIGQIGYNQDQIMRMKMGSRVKWVQSHYTGAALDTNP